MVMALPLGLGALLLYFFNESPKFLANIGRTKEAVDVLKRIHDINKRAVEKYPVCIDVLSVNTFVVTAYQSHDYIK